MVKVYKFKVSVWLYNGTGAWHFVTLPKKVTDEINFFFGDLKAGWGSLPVLVTTGKTSWKTSIFPDKESKSYILPIKKQVRQSENIKEGDKIDLSIELKR